MNNKKMRELLAEIQTKTAEAKALREGEDQDLDKASEIMDEVDHLTKEYNEEKRIYEAEKLTGMSGAEVHEVTPDEEKEVPEEPISGEALVAKEVRAILNPKKYGADKALVESVDENGGYTVPEDIQTQINQWPEVIDSLLEDIDVEGVTTNKGSRTYQKKGTAEAFTVISEGGSITTQIAAPNFERISYDIKDRAGFMPVSNDLLEDSDADINGVVVEWLGRANIATANAEILKIVQAKNQIALDGIDGIKEVVNVKLGQAYKATTKILTNDDGLNYLDTLKDENGRYLLNPDPTDSAKSQLRCGVNVIPVEVKTNDCLKTDGTKIPFIIGDLKEGIRKYDRKSMSIEASTVASIGDFNAFAMNMTLFRAILRDDYKELDSDAYYYCYIDVAAAETDTDGGDEEDKG